MTTLLPTVAPPPPPDDPEALDVQDPEVPPEIAEYRRAYRRRLLLISLPIVVIVALVALKLLSLPFFAGTAQATYDRGSYDGTVTASDGLGPVNVLEPWVRYFDRGTALGRIGVLVDSRSDLERALALVPASNVGASCRVRTDLVLVVEQQGDSAVLDQEYTQAEAFYAHALALYNAAPSGCFNTPDNPKSPPSKKPLQDAHGRLEQKQKQLQQQAGGSSGSGQSGQGGSQSGQGNTGQNQGDNSSGSSQNPLDQLQKRDQQAQQQEQQNNDRNRYFKQNPEQYSGKPW
ncbi:MAG: hypothetical protein JWP75_1252 [Frondihabitans sp.]|nr:hypothetical protein [Frondihabitans sp.]